MHPRNIYRKKRNFAVLGEEYPEFKQYLKYFDNGNATLDYKNVDALRCLTQTLLRKDFGLDVVLPLDRLIPAIPQRLNYVLWIEDLVNTFDTSSETIGLDVGTGASCVFPLLTVCKNPTWKFIATEYDEESFEYATKNVQSNNLSDKIKVIRVKSLDAMLDPLRAISENITFVMCNPPFFKEHHSDIHDNGDSGESSIIETRKPSNVGQKFETSTEGGENEFVLKLIEQSLEFEDKVSVFTTMLGKKYSMKRLKEALSNEPRVKCFAKTEFCQGKTLRWGIAWTFKDGIPIDRAPEIKHKTKVVKKMSYVLPFDMKCCTYTLDLLIEKVKSILNDDLELSNVNVVRQSKHSIEMYLKSQVNTWSNRRRKRREQQRQQQLSGSSSTSDGNNLTSPLKRKMSLSDDSDFLPDSADTTGGDKKVKSVHDTANSVEMKEETYLLSCSLTLKQKKKCILLKMFPLNDCVNAETTHQLFQYLKNVMI
ncbi:RNA N6-adenosine-methyltransferase METTL16 [Halotydeus destructor]|nr:RNA N6-adenosine-methyltransferase METTL16 [Halotydeus destructor]